MNDLRDVVADVVALNDGEMITKTRLQKTFYFLQVCGLFEDDLDFEYHYYGPFSFDIARAADDAEVQDKIRTSTRPGYHSEPYTVYSSTVREKPACRSFDADRAREKLDILRDYSGLELEVAATINYLRENGYGDDAVEETKRRKPVKASEKRVERAQELSRRLGLE
jgi:uncharacterized protein YwgA